MQQNLVVVRAPERVLLSWLKFSQENHSLAEVLSSTMSWLKFSQQCLEFSQQNLMFFYRTFLVSILFDFDSIFLCSLQRRREQKGMQRRGRRSRKMM
jgi:hypothetical protein